MQAPARTSALTRASDGAADGLDERCFARGTPTEYGAATREGLRRYQSTGACLPTLSAGLARRVRSSPQKRPAHTRANLTYLNPRQKHGTQEEDNRQDPDKKATKSPRPRDDGEGRAPLKQPLLP